MQGWILATVTVVALAACERVTPVTAGNPVTFTDEGATTNSAYEGRDPNVEIRKSGDRWLVTVYQGQKSTGGYSIRVERVTVGGTVLRIWARFTEPAGDQLVTQVLTSPAHTISIPFGADEVILFDQDDRERARGRS